MTHLLLWGNAYAQIVRDGKNTVLGLYPLLLRVKASHFKNCQDDTVIDLVAKSKKTTEDKEYELQEIAEGLYVYSIGAFVGKNASGKTTALELLDCC